MSKYFNNTNAIWGQVDQPKTSNNKITYYGDYHVYGNIDISQFTDEVLVWHKPEFPKEEWRYGLYGIKYKPEWDYVKEEDVMTIELLKQLQIPIIGLGTGGLDYTSTYNAVILALKIGYRLIDTAENYHNEEAVGNAIIDSGINRSNIIIISKYFGGLNYGNTNDVINSFNNSLKKLKTSYIDIYLIHKPFGCKWGNGEWEPIINNKYINYKNRLKVWQQFINLKKSNLVNYIGVSNWSLDNIQELKLNNLYNPDIIQIEWCPCFYDIKLYNYSNNNNIIIIGYGLFSRNSINEIKQLNITDHNWSPSQILIKWCIQRNIIIIPRSTNIKNLESNLYISKTKQILCKNSIEIIDNTTQKKKGHSLKLVYDKNYNINIWQPLILTEIELNNMKYNSNIKNLINGKISCIIINNLITKDESNTILKKLETKILLKHNIPFNNYNINFRGMEIGITLDNELWRNNPNKYWNDCEKVNKLFENIFDKKLNPLDIMFKIIKKIAGEKYIIKRMQSNNILSPKGLFRILTNKNNAFPYHTDGFNYGSIINSSYHINRDLYNIMSNKYDTNSVIAVIFKLLKQDSDYEINLYNCLVDDLEKYKNDLGMYSHWMGTKYSNINLLERILDEKPYYSPLVKCGSIYFFSASRIHKIDSFITNTNRIVLSTFLAVKNNEITIYQ